MPKKEYGWAGGNVPIIGEHSLAKHRILREYVQRYIEILTQNPRIDRLRLTLVDAFAGGGIYQRSGHDMPHLGSPAILIQATAAAQERVNTNRQKPVVVLPTFYFIDKSKANLTVLEETLRTYVYPSHPGVSPTVLCGTFEDRLAPLLIRIKQEGRAHRAIFILDQYGYTAVPLSSLQTIFRELPKAEVFLTLAVGWIAAYLRTVASAAEALRTSLGIRAEATEDEIEERLLGTEGSDAKLRVVQKLLHDAFVKDSGARYATPFFIVSRESHRPYWFLHLANSSRANDVVKELHWSIQNHFSHYGGSGLSMLGFDPQREPASGQLSFEFDDLAKQRTNSALLEQLPNRIGSCYSSGVPFGNLFAALANETPATKEMLRGVLTTLCRESVLIKRGGDGEQRRGKTPIRDGDVLTLSKQIRIHW